MNWIQILSCSLSEHRATEQRKIQPIPKRPFSTAAPIGALLMWQESLYPVFSEHIECKNHDTTAY